MPLKTLIVIALRLYTIYLIVEGLARLALEAPYLYILSTKEPVPVYFYFLAPLGMLLVAGALWVAAFRLSSKVTNGHDTQLNFTALTLRDLYAFSFVFLGIYFVLSSIFSTVTNGYAFFSLGISQTDENLRGRLLWPFVGHALTVIAGFACVWGAQNWTSKLIRLELENKGKQGPSIV